MRVIGTYSPYPMEVSVMKVYQRHVPKSSNPFLVVVVGFSLLRLPSVVLKPKPKTRVVMMKRTVVLARGYSC